jgi:ABC-2 type transport system ATP-binding protein
VLFSSHALSEVEQLADQVVIVSAGRLVGQGMLAELATGSAAVSVRTTRVDDLIPALVAAGGGAERTGVGGVRVTGLVAAEISRIARELGIDLDELTAVHVGLEQVFFKLTAVPGGQAMAQRPGSEQA